MTFAKMATLLRRNMYSIFCVSHLLADVIQMNYRFLLGCHFAVTRAWRRDRIGVISLCMLLTVSFGAALAALSQYRASQGAIEAIETSRFHERSSNRDSPDSSFPSLASFRSNELLDALNKAASTLALPVNEMVFRFDDNASHPYLRYSATVKLFGGYPVVRKFVDAVRKQLPQTSLDAISCSRTDIRSVHVACELTLSTFYRRPSHE